ncbi:glycosyltransferase [Patescibacteria group bacterium]|nr:glycosyltransferase [Patescibacteria group bacterium]
MRPLLSLIIPYHNSSETIGRLLASIARSKTAPAYEVIVVDDGSEKNATCPMPNAKLKKKLTDFRIITLLENRGPAAARNRGAANARGKVLLFLDSDVVLFPDTLNNLARIYREDPDVVAVTGVWAKEQRTKAFFPNFKALRDWSYWVNERELGSYYYLFSTRIASIKRAVFLRLGGFDESYHAALVEDIEFTYRIARRYAVLFAPDVRVRHEFEGFWPVAQKYFRRSYHWTKLFMDRRRFDSVAATGKEAAATLSAAALAVLVPMRVLTFFLLPHSFLCFRAPGLYLSFCTGSMLQWLVIAVLVIHLLFVRKFLWFAARERGIVFAFQSFLTGIVLYCFIFAGAVAGRVGK